MGSLRGPRFESKDSMVRFGDSQVKPGRLQTIVKNVDKTLEWVFSGEGLHDFRGCEEALIVVDTEANPAVYNLVAGQLPKYGVNPTIIMVPQRDYPNEPVSETVIAAAETADLIINMATYTVSHPLITAGIFENTDFLLLPDATEDRFCRGAIDADPAIADNLTRTVRDLLEEGSVAKVTSDKGTDIDIPLDGPRTAHAAGFPHNEAAASIGPMNDINGTIVQDSFIQLVGMLEEPVVWVVEEGWIVEYNGGHEADHLKYVLDKYGNENSNAFAEFAIQTNPWARPNGNLIEHKNVAGAVHTATGTNASMNIDAGIHLDGVMLEPTVEIDGVTIIEQGVLQLEKSLSEFR